MSKAKLLVTGFDAYGANRENASGQVIERLAQESIPSVATVVLRTSYSASEARIKELIGQLEPQVVLLLGQTDRTTAVRIERRAKNGDYSSALDNDGEIGRTPIIDAGPYEYASTTPIDEIYRQLKARGYPVIYSDDAGGYVCNHLFYVAQHHIATEHLSSLCGFVHLPSLKVAERAGLSQDVIYQAVRLVVETLLS